MFSRGLLFAGFKHLDVFVDAGIVFFLDLIGRMACILNSADCLVLSYIVDAFRLFLVLTLLLYPHAFEFNIRLLISCRDFEYTDR